MYLLENTLRKFKRTERKSGHRNERREETR